MRPFNSFTFCPDRFEMQARIAAGLARGVSKADILYATARRAGMSSGFALLRRLTGRAAFAILVAKK